MSFSNNTKISSEVKTHRETQDIEKNLPLICFPRPFEVFVIPSNGSVSLFLFLQAYRCESGPVLVRVLCV